MRHYTALFATMLLVLCACDKGDCLSADEYMPLYEVGYDLGEECTDWITVWHEDDGTCAAEALAAGYNAARSDAGADCGQPPEPAP